MKNPIGLSPRNRKACYNINAALMQSKLAGFEQHSLRAV
jgi:hypothetical protein